METYVKHGKSLAEFYKQLGEPKQGTKRFAPGLFEIKQGSRENTHLFTISTADEDREGDILEPKGVILENYLKNPVVLWSHDYWGLPIGRSLFVRPGAKAIRAEVEWAPTDFAQQVRLLVDTGFLKGASVGFDPKEWKQRDDMAQVDQYGFAYLAYHFTKWELLEWSAVAVPCNPMALIEEAKSKGIRVDVIEDAMRKNTRRVIAPKATTDLEEGEEEEDKKPKPSQPSAAPYPAVGHADTGKQPDVVKDGGPAVMQEADGTCRDAEGVVVPCGDYKPQPGGNQDQGKGTKDGGPPVLQLADGTCRDAEGVPVPCGDFKPQPGGNQNQGQPKVLVTKPFGDYEDFADCVASNQDKDDPEAYCGALKDRLEGKGVTITLEEMKSLCPSCAEKMEKANIAKLTIKVGATLNAANKARINQARDLLQQVLDESEPPEPEPVVDGRPAPTVLASIQPGLGVTNSEGVITLKSDREGVIRVCEDPKTDDASIVKLPVNSKELAETIRDAVTDAVKKLKGQVSS